MPLDAGSRVHAVDFDGGDLGRGVQYETLDDALADLQKVGKEIASKIRPAAGYRYVRGFSIAELKWNDASRLRFITPPAGTRFFESEGIRLFDLYDKEGNRERGGIFFLTSTE